MAKISRLLKQDKYCIKLQQQHFMLLFISDIVCNMNIIKTAF